MATFTERLAILIDAKTGGAVRDIQAVGTATENLAVPATRADKAVQALGLSGMVSGSQLKAGVAAGAAAAGFAFAAFAKNAVGEASALEEQVNRTGVVFGDAAGQVRGFADDSASSLGLSERAALQAAGAFGTIFTGIGAGAEEAAKLSEGMVRLASDMASFNDIGVDEALQKLQSGLAGEAEPLRQVGVFLTEAAVKAKAAELGLGGTNRELTEGEKVMARYALILEQTGKQQGDFARTSDSLANQQRVMQANMENLSATVGQVLVPAMTQLLEGVNSLLRPFLALTDMVGGLDKVGEAMATALPVLGPLANGAKLAGDAWDSLFGSEKDAADAAEDAKSVYQGFGSILSSYRAASDQAADAARERAEAEREATAAVQTAFLDARDAQESYDDALEGVSDAEREVERARRDVADANREAADEQRRLAEEVVRAQEAVEDANERVADSYDQIRQAEERQRRAFFQRQEAAEEAAEAERIYLQNLADFGPEHHLTVEALEEHTDAQQELSEREYDAQQATRDLQGANEDLADAQDEARDAQNDLTEAQNAGAEASDRSAEAAENLSDAEENLRDAQDEAARAAITLKEKVDEQEAALRRAGEAGAYLGDTLRLLAEQFPGPAGDALRGLAADADRLWLSHQQANSEIQRTLDLLALLPGFGSASPEGRAWWTPPSVDPDIAGVMFGTGGGTVNNFNISGSNPQETALTIAWILGGQ